ncbi:MAG: cytochrome c, partial [Thermoanaerobaculia bacterium]
MAKSVIVVIGGLAAVGALSILAAIGFAFSGVSAQVEPTAFEVRVARTARHWLIPSAARARSNPLPTGAEVLESSLRHWADHCASCHGNDGRGNTAVGQGLYPRAPDMTLPATQKLSDGELYWIVENGVKLTGMPAWGDKSSPGGDSEESWELVHFVRHLPDLSQQELQAMARFNPLSRAEFERELEIER